MPEFLVITTSENVLRAVEHIRHEDGTDIQVENDITKGLKAIFYRLPDAVFIQEEIAGITAEKVAGQVRTLLDDEPIRLVLLRENLGEWGAENLSFDAVVDVGLSFDELVSRLREELNSHHAPEEKQPDTTAEAVTGESASQAAPHDDGSIEFDPFSDIFPAQFHHDWGQLPLEHVHEQMEEHPFQTGEAASTAMEEEFCFETPGDIVSSLPLQSEPSPEQKKVEPSKPVESSLTAGAEEADKNVRFTDKESPQQLFASISEEQQHLDEKPHGDANASSSSLGDKLRLKGLDVQSSLLKGEAVQYRDETHLASQGEKTSAPSSPGTDGNYKHTASAESSTKQTGKSLPRSVVTPARHDFEGRSTLSGYRKTSRIPRFMMPLLILLLLGSTTYFLVKKWDSLSQLMPGGAKPVETTAPKQLPAAERLPVFFPSVEPDKAYSINHPGWERYPGGGLDYLAYRENGRLIAVQVVAQPEGKISDSFIRMCIRETTGLADAENWSKSIKGDFLQETGTLGNRGEIVVYRKMPEEEIRGVVLTFK